MNELIEFLTSKEIIIVYIVASLACFLCFIIYLAEKNNDRLRRKQNTKELNKLVEEIHGKTTNNTELIEEPVIIEEHIIEESNKEAASVIELLESTNEIKIDTNLTENINNQLENINEPKIIVPESINSIELNEKLEESPIKEESLELEYTSIEPDPETAKQELEKLTEELRKQEMQPENITLTNYEEEQEENAIISLEELVKKSKEMYAANEVTQYADEGNEPISLKDLEKRMKDVNTASYEEPFIIENVVKDEIVNEEVTPEVLEIESSKAINENVVNTSLVEDLTKRKFQSSPIISPIYGIEKQKSINSSELELENTANYEKLDEEIKKTNEFLMTLKELQKKLD
ncbi:MAG: hypothetical protein HFJ11_00280 [Bacilli bacterium]|nr:hypothetical protein [Bacilli bacterium]